MNDLITRCIQKDSKAWEELSRTYSGTIQRAVVSSLLGYGRRVKREDVEDLHHTVFQGLLEDDCRKLRQYRGECSLHGWLRVISARAAIDWLRRERNLVPLDFKDEKGRSLHERLPDQKPDQGERLCKKQSLELVKKAMEKLEPQERLLAVMVFEREMKPEEVARALKISLNNYFVRKNRLMNKLRESVQRTGSA